VNYLSVKKWDTFQHYKDRNPPWIKLHRELLRDYSFTCLQDASKAHLMSIWLLASQLDNKVPLDLDWIGKQIGATSSIDVKALIDSGFLIASEPLADCKQSAMPETETEAYKPDRYIPSTAARFDEWWTVYPKKIEKKKARDIWKRRKLDTRADDLIADVQQRTKTDGKWLAGFIPNPTTYLNGDRWEDAIEPQREAPKKPFPATEDGWHALAKELGVSTRTGEDWYGYKQRIREARAGSAH